MANYTYSNLYEDGTFRYIVYSARKPNHIDIRQTLVEPLPGYKEVAICMRAFSQIVTRTTVIERRHRETSAHSDQLCSLHPKTHRFWVLVGWLFRSTTYGYC